MGKQTINNGGSSTSNEAYLGLSDAINGNQRIGIRQYFTLAIPENGPRDQAKVGNTFLYHSAPDIVKFNDNLALSTVNRLYLPTSEVMRFETKQLGAIRNYLNLVQKAGKFEISANLLSQWDAHTQDRSEKAGNAPLREFYIVPYSEVGYSISDSLTVTQGLGLENLFRRAGPSAHIVDWYTAVGWQALKELSVTMTLENDIKTVDNENNSFQLYRDSETEVYLELSLAI